MLDGAARIERDMEAYAAGARGQVRILASVSAMAESLARRRRRVPADAAHTATSRSTWKSASARRSCAACATARRRWACAGTRPTWARCSHAATAATTSAWWCRAKHPLASRKSLRFDETLDYEHVSLPVNSAVQVMLQRAAAQLGASSTSAWSSATSRPRCASCARGLPSAWCRAEVAELYAQAYGLTIVPLD